MMYSVQIDTSRLLRCIRSPEVSISAIASSNPGAAVAPPQASELLDSSPKSRDKLDACSNACRVAFDQNLIIWSRALMSPGAMRDVRKAMRSSFAHSSAIGHAVFVAALLLPVLRAQIGQRADMRKLSPSRNYITQNFHPAAALACRKSCVVFDLEFFPKRKETPTRQEQPLLHSKLQATHEFSK